MVRDHWRRDYKRRESKERSFERVSWGRSWKGENLGGERSLEVENLCGYHPGKGSMERSMKRFMLEIYGVRDSISWERSLWSYL